MNSVVNWFSFQFTYFPLGGKIHLEFLITNALGVERGNERASKQASELTKKKRFARVTISIPLKLTL